MSVPRPRVFRVARFDPRTGRLLPTPPGQPLLGPPHQRRGFGEIPTPAGGPGNPVFPYSEEEVWNNEDGTGISAPPRNPITTPTGPSDSRSTNTLNSTVSVPFGESDRTWYNPTTFSTVPIQGSVGAAIPILSQNAQRNALVIQNNSSATSPDVAPTFYIGFNATPTVGFSMALAPGVGFSWDIITPRDSIYILIGPFTGASVKVAGAVIQGTYAPISSSFALGNPWGGGGYSSPGVGGA